MNTCKTCRHWDRISPLAPIATCRRITECSEGAEVDVELSGYGGDGWSDVAFKTEAGFGCTLWEQRMKRVEVRCSCGDGMQQVEGFELWLTHEACRGTGWVIVEVPE